MRKAMVFVGTGAVVLIIGAYYASNHAAAPSAGSDTIRRKIPTATSPLPLTSSAFAEGASIPSRFTCDGDRSVSPALVIAGVPDGTKSLALIMDDPDVPQALHADGVFDHWVLFNISSQTREIPEGGRVGVGGANGAGKNAYTGPCPPPQYEPSEHRYIFKLYALDSELPLQAGATKADVEKVMEGTS